MSTQASYGGFIGIHGLPKEYWDGVKTEHKEPEDIDDLGYCAHSIPTFPTWHRPYLAMLEV